MWTPPLIWTHLAVPRASGIEGFQCIISISSLRYSLHCIFSNFSPSAPTPSVATTTDAAVTVGGTSAPTDQPFYMQAGFIIGMVILGVVVVFPLIVLVLCRVRPKGSGKFSSGRPKLSRNVSGIKRYSSYLDRSNRYGRMGSPAGSPEYGHAAGKWRPGDVHQVSRVCVREGGERERREREGEGEREEGGGGGGRERSVRVWRDDN